jgi:hypothetical protein
VGLSLLEIGYEATGGFGGGRIPVVWGGGGVLRLLAGIRQPIASRENRAPSANRILPVSLTSQSHLESD